MFGRKKGLTAENMPLQVSLQCNDLINSFRELSDESLGIVVSSATIFKNNLLKDGYILDDKAFVFNNLWLFNNMAKTGYKDLEKGVISSEIYTGIIVMIITLAAHGCNMIPPALEMWKVLERGFPYVESNKLHKGIEDLPNLLKRLWEMLK